MMGDEMAWNPKQSRQARGYGRAWELLRALVLTEEPTCRLCRRAPAVEVDHIVEKAQGGTDARSNLQGLCKPCHAAKTAGRPPVAPRSASPHPGSLVRAKGGR